jgi:gamma-glutamylputrescine oxidase
MKQQHVNSYYAATRNFTGDFPTLEESVECDVCMIGAGYTGLSSALFLTEAGYSVTVLEAAKVGYGASGRNGGQLVNSYSRDVDVIEERYGDKTAEILGSMIFEGADIIRSAIKHYDIQCDYRPGGIFAAMNKKQLKGLAEQKKAGSATATRT